jgi:hypothetical protein
VHLRLASRTVTLSFTAFAALGACNGNSLGDDGGDHASGGGTGATTSGGSAGSGAGGGGAGTPAGAGAPSTGGAATGGSATGGSAGSASGGAAGGAALGGSGGATPAGGAGGSAGGGDGHECETDEDCTMYSDCCTCAAVVRGTPGTPCERVCTLYECAARGIDRAEVACRFGRCVIDRSCNLDRVTCDDTAPSCDDGEVASVTDAGCYGPCLPPSECSDVTSCAACGAGEVCVNVQAQIFTYGCVKPGASCTKGNYCECLDACAGSICAETDDSVQCVCLGC